MSNNNTRSTKTHQICVHRGLNIVLHCWRWLKQILTDPSSSTARLTFQEALGQIFAVRPLLKLLCPVFRALLIPQCSHVSYWQWPWHYVILLWANLHSGTLYKRKDLEGHISNLDDIISIYLRCTAQTKNKQTRLHGSAAFFHHCFATRMFKLQDSHQCHQCTIRDDGKVRQWKCTAHVLNMKSLQFIKHAVKLVCLMTSEDTEACPVIQSLVLSDKNMCKVLQSSACWSNCVSQCQDNSPAKVVITGQLNADRSVIGEVII